MSQLKLPLCYMIRKAHTYGIANGIVQSPSYRSHCKVYPGTTILDITNQFRSSKLNQEIGPFDLSLSLPPLFLALYLNNMCLTLI